MLGRKVFLCKGRGGSFGRCHEKAVVIDSRVACVGGQNLTDQAARRNAELVVRMVDPRISAYYAQRALALQIRVRF